MQMELPMPVSGLPLDLRTLAADIHASNIAAGWWKQTRLPDENIHPGAAPTMLTLPRNVGELLALIHSEISEADVGFDADLMDDKLPHRRMTEVELADVSICVLDMLGFYAPKWVQDDRDSGPLALPLYAYWPDWCRLMHRTTTEALEHFRKGREEEGCRSLDKLLGVVHFAAIQFGYDLTGAIIEKRAFNQTRSDHQLSNRAASGGKQF